MSRTIRVALEPSGTRELRFPEACVSCAGAPITESRLVFSRLVAHGGRQEEVERRIDVPHCERCARVTKVFFLASFVPLMVGFVTAGGATAVLATLHASAQGWDEIGQPRVTPNSMVIGGVLGLTAGLLGGFLLELVVRVVLVPFYGRPLWRAPLLAPQFWSGADWVAGLEAKPDRDLSSVSLRFANEEIARRFAERNESARSADSQG